MHRPSSSISAAVSPSPAIMPDEPPFSHALLTRYVSHSTPFAFGRPKSIFSAKNAVRKPTVQPIFPRLSSEKQHTAVSRAALTSQTTRVESSHAVSISTSAAMTASAPNAQAAA